MNCILTCLLTTLLVTSAIAAPVSYELDPTHTYPSFEADHLGGLSVWRGKFDHTEGKVTLDKVAHAGMIEVTVQTNSIDFGMEKMNEHAKSAEIFDVARFPTATFIGRFSKWSGDVPTEAQGTFTLHGVSRPLTLAIDAFKCITHPMKKIEACGADASATLKRSDFGVNYGEAYGFSQQVILRIQVEGSPAV